MKAEAIAQVEAGRLKCGICDNFIWRLCIFGCEILWCSCCKKSNARLMGWN